MKRLSIALITVLLVLFSVCADVTDRSERVWYYSDGGGGSGWNILAINLEKAYYVPKYGTAYNKSASDGDRENGTYAKATNVIGNIGCAFTDHVLEFTVSTDGRFVSQSDPSKYRNFVVAIKPRYRRTTDGDDVNYNFMPDLVNSYDDNLRVPNTRNGDAVLYSPPMPRNGNNTFSHVTLGGTQYKVQRYYFDMCICMDELTTEDLTHLATGDDYIAIINVSWRCTDNNCNVNESGNEWHNGSFTFAVKGYYGVSKPSNETVFLQVNPEPSSMNLDLVRIATEQPTADIKVADLQIYTMAEEKKNNKDWLQRLSVYVSADMHYNNVSSTGFRLVNTTANNSYYIPYKVVVKDYDLVTNTESSNTGNALKAFDGKVSYSTLSSGTRIDLNQQQMVNKNSLSVYSVAYAANVYIRFDLDGNNDIRAYSSTNAAGYKVKDADSNDLVTRETVSSALAGIYTSNIYYYIIWN